MTQHKAQLGADGRLSDEQIKKLISARMAESRTLDEYRKYFEGKNVQITKKADGEKIAVPYGRTLILIIVGFMYKSGLIRYALAPGDTGNEEYLRTLTEAFGANDEPLMNTELGQDQAAYGEAYELHYIDEAGEENFARVSPQEFIPVYSYEIKPRLIAGIRSYAVTVGDKKVTEVDVYYSDRIEKYTLDEGLKKRDADQPHPYESIPVAVYRNNADSLGDIEPIKGIIDAYDTLISTYVDDEQKFAEAVLLMYGKVIDDETVEKLNRLRVIDNLMEGEEVKYLTKDETQSTRNDLIDLLKQEIHRHSFVPDMTDPSVLGQKSGEAFQYLFALFELMASVKEAYFAQGIADRIRLTTMGIMNPNGAAKDHQAIKIEFARNLPKDSVMWAGIVKDLWGMLPASALVKLLPFVEDPEGLIEEIEAEAKKTVEGITAEEVKDAYRDRPDETV